MIDSGENNRPRKEYTEILRLQKEHLVKFKLDCGSEANVLPAKVFLKINKGYQVARSNVLLKGFGNVIYSPLGEVKLLTETQFGHQKECNFLISKEEKRPLLGIDRHVQIST